MVDPVVVCAPPVSDTYLHLTGVAWTAVSSFVSGASVIAWSSTTGDI
jgi:hypothetical protein